MSPYKIGLFGSSNINVVLKVNIFQGITLPDAPRFGKVFGGQFIGQVKLKCSLSPPRREPLTLIGV